jgi:hypothetical protein
VGAGVGAGSTGAGTGAGGGATGTMSVVVSGCGIGRGTERVVGRVRMRRSVVVPSVDSVLSVVSSYVLA